MCGLVRCVQLDRAPTLNFTLTLTSEDDFSTFTPTIGQESPQYPVPRQPAYPQPELE